jgi:hypothetical protein
MKAKKALKRLTRVEALLTEVLEEYTAAGADTRQSLDSAKASIERALESSAHDLARAAAKKQASRQRTTKKRVATAKKRVKAPAARKRRIVAKRKPAARAPASVPSVPEIAATAEA